MQTHAEGYYLDGQTPKRHRAVVHFMPDGLRIVIEDSSMLWWPYEEIHQSPHAFPKEEMGLERGGEIPEILLLPSAIFLQGLKGIAPEVAKRFHDQKRRKNWVMITLLSALGIAVVMMVLYVWGIPALASLVASQVPVTWEEHLGQSVVQHLAPPEKRCLDPVGREVVDRIAKQLTTSSPQNPYTIRVFVVKDQTVNALAAPGGYLILYEGLLKRTKTPEELAGVLAHEMQHIFHRHPTKALLQHVSTRLLISAMMGDARGAMAFGLESARILGILRYSRQSEGEADRGAIQMLAASGMNPAGLATFFEGIQKEESLRLPAYLSTHPELGERIHLLKGLAEEVPVQSKKLLPDYPWEEIHGMCK